MNNDKTIIYHLSYSQNKVIYTKLNATTGDNIGSFYEYNGIWTEVYETTFYDPLLIFSAKDANNVFYISIINTTDDNFLYSFEADNYIRIYHVVINPNNGLLNIAGSKFLVRQAYYAQAPLSSLSLIDSISDASLSYSVTTNYNITDTAISISPVFISLVSNTSLSSPATLEYTIQENFTLDISFNLEKFEISVVENLFK